MSLHPDPTDVITRLRLTRATLPDGSPQDRACQAAMTEIESLRRWKREALEVLDRWNNAFEMAGIPSPPLGAHKADVMLHELCALRYENESLRDQLAAIPCECDSHTGLGDDLWQCDECGEVIRYVDDPAGSVTLTLLHPYQNRKVRIEVVTPGSRPGNREWWS